MNDETIRKSSVLYDGYLEIYQIDKGEEKIAFPIRVLLSNSMKTTKILLSRWRGLSIIVYSLSVGHSFGIPFCLHFSDKRENLYTLVAICENRSSFIFRCARVCLWLFHLYSKIYVQYLVLWNLVCAGIGSTHSNTIRYSLIVFAIN